jgi:OOP family OmpA-OmpF porin
VAYALALGFASAAAQAQQLAPAPAPYVAPAAPALVAAVAPQPEYEKVVLDANVLFAFDKSELSPAGRETLDRFVATIQGIGSGSIKAIGYADRFGTSEYNQALSERRVATVKEYLVSKGVQPNWMVRSAARGESEPTTKAGECTGERSASTIACLQPDRHVFVELSGSRIKQ